MAIEKIIEKLKTSSIKDTKWIKEARFRQRNKWWLDILFKIKLKYLMLKRRLNKS